MHFCEIPSYSDELINEQTILIVKRMQNAIETGRLVRDRVNISMKYPLRSVTLVDADPSALDGFKLVEKYLKEELNCLELKLESNEDAYVVYKADPDHRAMGQAFGKKFDKNAKKAIGDLSSDAIRTYLKTGTLDLNGLPLVEGMLKISKDFQQSYTKHKTLAVQSSMLSAVMLDTAQDEELRRMGLAREVVNRIQRLRKTSGISIDDQIEIYWHTDSGLMLDVLGTHGDRMQQTTRMPVLKMPNGGISGQVHIGTTEFVNPDNEKDHVAINIYLAGPKFNVARMEEEFAAHGPNFVKDLRSYFSHFDRASLAALVKSSNGAVSVSLDGKKVTLKHKEHFWLDAREQHSQ